MTGDRTPIIMIVMLSAAGLILLWMTYNGLPARVQAYLVHRSKMLLWTGPLVFSWTALVVVAARQCAVDLDHALVAESALGLWAAYFLLACSRVHYLSRRRALQAVRREFLAMNPLRSLELLLCVIIESAIYSFAWCAEMAEPSVQEW